MQKNPHLLIEGIIIARLRGRREPRRSSSSAASTTTQADILDAARRRGATRRATSARTSSAPTTTLDLVVHRGAGAYICGEETALLDSLEGKRGNPRLKPPFPANQGLYQGPTLINNVETLMNVPHHPADGRRGVREDRHRDARPARSSSRSRGNVQRPGNYEIELGIPSREIIYDLAGGPPDGPRGQGSGSPAARASPVLTGRRASTCPTTSTRWPRPARCSARARSSSSTTRPRSSTSRCKTAKFYRHESCGKCTPCREGTNWTVKMLERIDRRRGDADGPRHHGLGLRADHRQLPVRARRRDGDADRLDDRARSATSSRRYIEAARERNGLGAAIPQVNRDAHAGPMPALSRSLMPRPDVKLDHLHDRRPRGQGAGERDARRRRQVRRRRDPGLLLRAQARPAGRRLPHVPGRDRGHPEAADRAARRRSRTAWSSTRRPSACTRRSSAVVEFLLINHPLDCPVCDKGGECPLQDITFGWGRGHVALHRAQAPLREAARAVAADRDRPRALHPLLPLRALLAGGLRGLPAGPATSAARTPTSATFDGHPYVAPFSGNIIELCPVGALTSRAYRFRARPWDIEGAGIGLHALPGAVQRRASPSATSASCACSRATTTRSTTAGCATRAASPTRPIHVDERITQPLRARGRRAACRRAGSKALDAAGGALEEGRRRRGRARRRRRRPTRRRFLLAAAAPRRRSARAHLDSRAGGDAAARRCRARSPTRRCRRPCPTSSSRTPCSCSTASPSTTRRSSTCGSARACAATASSSPSRRARPSSLDPNADAVAALRARRRRGASASRSTPRSAGDDGDLGGAASAAGSNADRGARARRRCSRGAGEDVVIVYGERLLPARAAPAARALLNLAARLGLAGHAGAGPARAARRAPNGRGLREAGFAARRTARATRRWPRPAATPTDRRGRSRAASCTRVWLLHVDPLRDLPDRARVGGARSSTAHDRDRPRRVPHRRRCASTPTSSSPPRPTPRRRARSRTPTAASSACARRSAARADRRRVRAGWQVIAELARARRASTSACSPGRWPRSSCSTRSRSTPGSRSTRSAAAACAGPTREAAARSAAAPGSPLGARRARRRAGAATGALRLGTFRSLWAAHGGRRLAGAAVPARRASVVELSPADAERARRRATATASRSASNGTRVQRRRATLRAGACPRGHASSSPTREHRVGRASRRPHVRPRRGRPSAPSAGCRCPPRDGTVTPLAEVGYYEPWWIQILKARGDLRGRLPARAARAARRAQAPRALPAPLRPQPRRPVRRCCSRSPTSCKLLFKEQFRPAHVDRLAVRARAGRSRCSPRSRRSRSSRSATPSTSSARRSGSTASTSSIGILYAFAFGAIAFYGLMLGGWASGSKYSFLGSMRAAAQLISYEVAQGLALVGVVMMAGTLSLTEIVEAQEGMWYIVPAVRRLPHLPGRRLRRDQPRRRSTSPRPTPSSSAATTPSTAAARFAAYFFAEYLNIIVVSALDGDALPRRLAAPVRHRPADAGSTRSSCSAKMLALRLPLHLGPRDAAAPALRPADVASAGRSSCRSRRSTPL